MSDLVKKRNIFLTGMMGAGKSTIGEIVARKLAYMFVDTDEVIARKYDLTIADIFEHHGEDEFRKEEGALLEEITQHEHQVVATGGGMLVNDRSFLLATSHGLVVHLTAPIESLVTRLSGVNDRPLLSGHDLRSKLEEISRVRAETYNRISVQIDTSAMNKEDTADRITELFMSWLSE